MRVTAGRASSAGRMLAAARACRPVAPSRAADAGPRRGSRPRVAGRLSAAGVGTCAIGSSWAPLVAGRPARGREPAARQRLAGPCPAMVRCRCRWGNPGFRICAGRRVATWGTGRRPQTLFGRPGGQPNRAGRARARPRSPPSGPRGDGGSGAPAVVQGVVPTARRSGADTTPPGGRRTCWGGRPVRRHWLNPACRLVELSLPPPILLSGQDLGRGPAARPAALKPARGRQPRSAASLVGPRGRRSAPRDRPRIWGWDRDLAALCRRPGTGGPTMAGAYRVASATDVPRSAPGASRPPWP